MINSLVVQVFIDYLAIIFIVYGWASCALVTRENSSLKLSGTL